MKKELVLLLIFILPLITFSQVQIGLDIDGEAGGDNSGHSVSLSSDGNTLAISAPYNDGIGSDAGHVRVFENIAGTWTQKGVDFDGEAVGDAFGWRVSLSSDGSIVAIGAIYNNSNTGHVRIYKYNSGTTSWDQLGGDIDGETLSDQSGRSVSLSSDGSIVAIGAISNNSSAGHVRIYEYNLGTTSWDQLGGDIDGEASSDNSGWSVSLSDNGNIVAIGAPNNNGIGHIRVYEYNSGTTSWDQLGGDINGEAGGDKFGRNVSLSSDGNIVAIGAYQNDNSNGADSGHVRVFENILGIWTQIGLDIDGEAGGDNSGWSVSLSDNGSIIAIGAYKNDGTGFDSGHVRIYQNVSGTWTQIGLDINGEAITDFLGSTVSLSSDGNIVAIGAPQNNGNGADSGHVRVYDLSAEVLGISDEFVVNNFTIYPNPVTTNLYIKLTNELEFISANLFNYLGKSVLKSTKSSINVSSVTEGIYFLKVETNKGIGIKKIIIN